jgi:hypothetical protein
VAYSNEDDNKEMFYYDERYELELKMKRFNGTHEIHEVVNRQGDQGAILFSWKTPAPSNDSQAFIQINNYSDPEDVFAEVLRQDPAEDYNLSTDSVMDLYANDDPALMSPDTMPAQTMSEDSNLAITVGTVSGTWVESEFGKNKCLKRFKGFILFRCGLDSGCGVNRVSGCVVFSLQTPGGLAEGIFYESSLAVSSFCEFF